MYPAQQTKSRWNTRKKSKTSSATLGPANPMGRLSPKGHHLNPVFSWNLVCTFTTVPPFSNKILRLNSMDEI
jgi:hypothetical protein